MPQDYKTKVANALRRLRVERRLTIEQVASICGVTKQAVGRWEKGETLPTIDKVWILSDFFGVSVAEVMGKVEVTTREIIAAPTTSKED